MVYHGTVRDNRIELDEPLQFAEGTRISVSVEAQRQPRKGSPRAVLALAGTLTSEEADAILKAAQECRRIDESLWADGL